MAYLCTHRLYSGWADRCDPESETCRTNGRTAGGNYLFCINPELESFSDADFRNDLKAFVSGETEVLFDAGLPHMTLSVCKTDYPLLRYATALCERLTAAGADVTLKQHSETMLRSRAINGRYQLLLVSENMLDATALPDADILLLSAEEMEDPSCEN